MPNDRFEYVAPTFASPPLDAAPVAFPAGADFTPEFVSRSVSIGGDGTLHVLTAAGRDRTIPAGSLAAGVVYPLRVSKVFADSTATGIVLWE